MMVDDDDVGFGEFKFSSLNPTVHSNPTVIDGRDSAVAAANDDDDWGDFVNSGGLSHTLSRPKISKPLDLFDFSTEQKMKNNESELNQPGSAPGRVNSDMAQWEKPKGALPLSIFGDLEEQEEESGAAGDPSFGNGGARLFSGKNVDSVENRSGVNVNDLVANLYKQSDPKNGFTPDLSGSNSVDETNKYDTNSDLNLSLLNLGVVEPNQNAHPPDSSWNWVFPNANDLNANGKDEIKLNSHWSNLDWDPLNLNTNVMNSNKDGTNSVSKEVKWGSNGGNSLLVADNGGFDNGDDDDGWEFKDAEPKTPVGDEISKTNHFKSNNGPVPNLNGSSSNWNELSLEFNGWNSNFNSVNSSTNSMNPGLVGENREVVDDGDGDDEDDGWEFMVADSKPQVGDDKDGQIKTEPMPIPNFNGTGLSWDVLSSDSSGLNPNEVKSDEKHFTVNLIAEKKDSGNADGWAFKGAEPELQDDERMPENFEGALYTFGFGNGVHGQSDFGFDFNSSYKNKRNDIENKLHYPQVDAKAGSDEHSWAFKDAFSEAGSKEPKVAELALAVEPLVFGDEVQGNKVKTENHEGALPLSLFGDEETEADDPMIHQDISTQKSTSDQRVDIKGPHLNISINDLISSLYSRAEQSTSVNDEQSLRENGLDFTKSVMTSNLANANHDFDVDSWEFQDVSTGARAEYQTAVIGLGESHTKYSTKTELDDYVEFFSKLKKELHYIVMCHLENLKKTQSSAALIGEDAKVQALDKEIQDFNNELHQDSTFSGEVDSDNCSLGNVCLDMFVEVLQEPKFQGFESECHLTKKLSLAESDLRSAIELLRYVALTLKILTSVPSEKQSSYISAWSKMLSVCAQELRHGAFIWKRSLQENVHEQILSKPQGKKYVLALGEIYRVVEILGSSSKLYKPWILASSTDPMDIFTLLSECSSQWSSSGLEEALHSILNSPDFEYDESLKTLLESIKYIHDLDAHRLYNHVFSGQGPTCHLSALTAGTLPGMKTVVWNGENCFLTLANLWANLVSSDPPNLPCIHVGC
ncbi:hypothetical protein P3X46_035118 [Hevea brasiliensis]|uniref:Synergin gamma C-terminal domain-containing protein n=1 Tax=Hevea brasiliensis TaxID=3981 RepID=A0ABQ9KC07_HEVBR|nr:uncharacterized protein LOC110660216 isoform X2 [Hevea brasiliensis]KAJ9131462.1 hypothetical protein P3X46_035118 [Hevea brasiliensis]